MRAEALLQHLIEEVGPVRTRAYAKDQFAGLAGLGYIKARGLSRPLQRVLTSAHQIPLQSERV